MQKIADVELQCKRCSLVFTVFEGHTCDCGEIICPECHGLSEESRPTVRAKRSVQQRKGRKNSGYYSDEHWGGVSAQG